MREKLKIEYDFSKMKGAVRGKYPKAYREGRAAKIHKMDGTTVVLHFRLEEGFGNELGTVRSNAG